MTKNTINEHEENLMLYREASRIASCAYPAPLTEEQRDAYLLLPSLIELCKDSCDDLDPAERPLHYLLACTPPVSLPGT
jgi:hypothetical protein